MKRFLSILSLVVLGFASTSCYDDSALRESIEDLDGRVKTLETLCTEMNSNITALTSLVTAMSVGDYVVSVTPLKEDGVEVGYQIIFKENGVVNLYHGKDGVDGINGTDGTNGTDGIDGETPVIGAQVGEDGIYYWTLNGEFVVDAEGNKIPLTAPAPKVKVEEEKWFVSYDNGKTWLELGPAVTVGIKDVEYTDDVLVLTMNDGTKINVKIGSGFKVVLGEFDVKTLNYGSDLVIPYTIEGAEGEVVVFLLKEADGFGVELVEESATAGKVVISQQEAASKEISGKVGIFASGEDGTTVSKAVRFNSGVLVSVESNKEVYDVEAAGGKVEFTVATNVAFEVKTSADWVTYAQTKAVAEETLTFVVAENEGDAREAEVKITSGNVELGFKVAQAGGYVPMPEESLVGNYLVTFMWVYGGTGPEYGGGGWVDMHNKTWWFDETTGHGIWAELDNYLEITLDSFNDDFTQSTGKCINWAGKDGKNWDTWFYNNYDSSKGAYRNPDAPKDGSNFYRQIPIGESTWVRDYTVTPNTVTFTDAEGKKTVLEVYDAPYTFVPGYNDSAAAKNTRTFPRTGVKSPISGVNENATLSFHAVLKGEKNWDKNNTEIDKLFYMPRDLMIDVKKVDEIPAEAKTTEAKWVPEFPEEEEPENELPATLAGTYKYNTDVTFAHLGDSKWDGKGLIAQYGTWTEPLTGDAAGRKFCDIINTIKNDTYTFVATGTDSDGNEIGTVSFDGGSDGTWEYQLMDNTSAKPYTVYDATELYGFIAHDNSTTYVYDKENAKITFTTRGKQYVVDYLLPGEHIYHELTAAANKFAPVNVPASGFGMYYDMGYTSARVPGYSSTSNGLARHYVWACEWVLCLEKQ